MKEYKPFNLVKNGLTGKNLIEASAGTGKTYTIAGLYLRLILEAKIPVEKILVVTFTEAATQELKERIRLRLKEAAAAFSRGSGDDPLLNELIHSSKGIRSDLESLKEALSTFDQAAVFTIHGFCQRMLVENAFESGSLFETELVANNNDLVNEILKDFWRIHLYESGSFFADYLKQRKIQPLSFYPFVTACLKPGLVIKPESDYQDPEAYEQSFSAGYNKCLKLWLSLKNEVSTILLNDPGLNRQKYGKKNLPLWLKTMEDYFSDKITGFPVPDCLEKFTSDYMARPGSVKKNQNKPENPFFDSCTELFDACSHLKDLYNSNILWYKLEAASYLKAQLDIRKQKKGISGFDDLLTNLHRGLKGENGDKLAENIRRKYAVALIDEFQDTDPIQYEIFLSVFGEEQTRLFMIGDPKQAIYGFRGADIFAYMNAVRDADSAYTLSYNYRSEPEMIDAVNSIFNTVEDPFVFNRIDFLPVKPAELKNRPVLKIEDDNSFFNIWQLSAGEKPLTKGAAAELVPEAVAGEIARLLNLGDKGRALIGEERLKKKDIAVLVRTNSEAFVIKETLNQSGIPAVIYSTGDIFDTAEAGELERILSAIVTPGNEGLVKAALVSDIFGYKGEDFAQFEEKSERFERLKDNFRNYHELWIKSGFIRMFNTLMTNEKVLVRLMSFSDGERRSTNLLHLGQLLQQISTEKKYGAERLLKWLNFQRNPLRSRSEENQLRLESDDDSVRIITIHKSKGMEYPVVFCPYTWSGKANSGQADYFVFHDQDNNMALTLDAGSDAFQLNKKIAEKEALAEDLRLLYVALTRAKSRCYTIWGRVKGAENTAFAYLLHRDQEKRVRLPDNDKDLNERLEKLAGRSDKTIQVKKVSSFSPEPYRRMNHEKTELRLRRFRGHIDSGFKIASFSSLSSTGHRTSHGEDRDAFPVEKSEKDTKVFDIFSFPRGAAAGTFMHSIFENIDFTSEREDRALLVEQKLSEFGFDLKWKDAILTMVENVLSTSLEKDNSEFKLSKITSENRLNELEFYFPLKQVTSDALNAVLQKHDAGCRVDDFLQNRKRLDFSPVKGFMKGFIDLIFRMEKDGREQYFIVDWKSNWLGDTIEAYNQEKLSMVMDENFYVLQYLLYSLALNRYLMLRLGDAYNYDRDFGGALYIFLRGVLPEFSTKFGIFQNKPSYDFISDLSDLLLEE